MICSYEGNQKVTLDMHVRSVHNHLWFKCGHCDYKASQKCNLVRHKQFKQEGRIYYYDVTNVVIQYVISRNLTNTFRKMYTKMAGMSSTVMNVTLKQPRHILSNPTWQPSMMENAFSVINVITRVPQSNH